MKKTISFLLGSGFSIPTGIPGVSQLNERLSKIHEGEIMIHTSMKAIWLNGEEDNNRWMNPDQRFFLQEFLEFYNEEILGEGGTFHYETFYDFYAGYIHDGENAEVIERFCQKFNEKYCKSEKNPRNCRNRIIDFNNSFNQLLASELLLPHHMEDVGLIGYPYGGIFTFLEDIVKGTKVKVHSLNHDLFFDFIASKQSGLFEHYSDGFKLAGSPFYGDLNHRFQSTENGGGVTKSYKVKLARFVDEYATNLAFYKLHGSVFTSIVNTNDNGNPYIRIKNDYGVSNFYEERTHPESGQPYFALLFDQVAPDFLSGTTNKTRYYTRDPYYVKLLGYFQENLSKSELLFVIGYGFQDVGINEYVEKYFLQSGKRMIVVSPSKPSTDLIEKYGATHIPKSVVDVSYDEYISFLPDGCINVKKKKQEGEILGLEDF